MACLKLGSKSEVFNIGGHTWLCSTGLKPDVMIQFPLLSRSGYLETLFSTAYETACVTQLHEISGGPDTFLLVAKFCYGAKIEVTPENVVSLRCAAEYFQISENYGDDNLIFLTESFLNDNVHCFFSHQGFLCRGYYYTRRKCHWKSCTHAAQNERLPLRVIVQVLFIEQIRLRTSISGWFFDTDSNTEDGTRSKDPARERHNGNANMVMMDGRKERVYELEKECTSMKQDLDKPVKTKEGRNFFSKLFRLRSKRLKLRLHRAM
ncbi:hypothetical protein Bca101_024171 [Brassica carinata]